MKQPHTICVESSGLVLTLQGLYFADYLKVMSATLVISRNNSTD